MATEIMVMAAGEQDPEGMIEARWHSPLDPEYVRAFADHCEAVAADARAERVTALRRHEQAIAWHRGQIEQLQVDAAIASGWWGCLRWLLTGRAS